MANLDAETNVRPYKDYPLTSFLSMFEMDSEDEVLDRELQFELGKRFEAVLATLLIEFKSFFEERRVGNFRIKSYQFSKEQGVFMIECTYSDDEESLSAPDLLRYGGYDVSWTAGTWMLCVDVNEFEEVYNLSKTFLPTFYDASMEMLERMRARIAGAIKSPADDPESQRAQGIVSLLDAYAGDREDLDFLNEVRIRLRLMAFLGVLFGDELNYTEEGSTASIKYFGKNKVVIALKQSCLEGLDPNFLDDFAARDQVQIRRFPVKNLMLLTVDAEIFDRFSRP